MPDPKRGSESSDLSSKQVISDRQGRCDLLLLTLTFCTVDHVLVACSTLEAGE